MALKPVKPGTVSRSPMRRTGASPFVPAYVQKTKSNSGLWIFLLLVLAGGAFWYVYTHQETPVVDKKPKVIVTGTPNAATNGQSDNNQNSPKKTALGTVGAKK